ncbi:MAG: helix-turn-helix domain-containing protein [Victivallales bacterium]|nr:helix-turn-helix domain-containing protein [Victivallales bacterium]
MALGSRQKAKVAMLLAQCAKFLPGGCVFAPRVGDDAEVAGKLCSFCRACLRSAPLRTACRRSMISGAFQALSTGEPYYFRCWAGLNTVVFPLAPGGRLEGAFEVGGFLYPGEHEDTARFIADAVANVSARAHRELVPEIRGLPEWSALEIRGIAEFVFEGLFSAGINQVDHFRELHERYRQQRRLGELVQGYARSSVTPGELHEVFAALVHALALREGQEVMRQLDEFFSRIMLSTSLNADQMKAHIHVLLAYLSRETVVRGGHALSRAFAENLQELRELEALVEVEDICYWTFTQVRRHLERLETGHFRAGTIAERVLDWLEGSFRERVVLPDVAKAVGASVSTVVQGLRRETKKTFQQHLRGLRLREARTLLADTDTPIALIATQCGFCDQSHLTRSFRRELGVTPRRYRLLAGGG